MFDGYRVLELGTWVLVPAAATVLADFGAEVIKIEHPRRGDPQRGLSTSGITPNVDGVSIAMEQTNRGKRSVGLDVAVDEGRDVLYELAARSDVFMTSFLPAARQKLRIDVEHIRARNPDIVYVRADALGPRDLCHHLGRADLLADPRFVDAQARSDNGAACAEELAGTFASAPLDEWRRRLATLRAPWEVVQNQLEVLDDPQARDNGYVTEVDHPAGRRITVVRAPVQFDEALTPVGNAPEPGAHTEEVLLEIGHDWDDIARYQEQGAIA